MLAVVPIAPLIAGELYYLEITDEFRGSYYDLIEFSRPLLQGAYTATVTSATYTPDVGANNEIALTVKNSLGNTDTGFDGAKDVTISGVEAAPDGAYGSFNGTALNAGSAGV